jgi:predicted MPP superfamily phosphohydrolase
VRERIDHQARQPSASERISRRAFVGMCAGTAVLATIAGSALLEHRDTTLPVLREIVVPVAGLTHEVTVVQASDLHGAQFGQAEGGLDALLGGRHVDAAVMTGDILDTWTPTRQTAYDLAALLRARTPRLYFLPGNHDPLDLGADLESHGVVTLQHATPVGIDPADPAGSEIALVYGVDSASIAGAAEHGSTLLIIASHTPPNATRLQAGAALGGGVRLFIAGHTHGGQIRIPGFGALFAPMTWDREEGGHSDTNDVTFAPDAKGMFVDGLYERDGQQVFVNVGLGTSGFHARFLDRSELVLFRFTPMSA